MYIKKIAETPELKATVADNLESDSAIDALSARQGKILNENIENRLPLTGGEINGNLSITGETTMNQALTLWHDLNLNSPGPEGGELHLNAPVTHPEQNGIIVDNLEGVFRIFGRPSEDGVSKTGVGAVLYINPYAGTFDIPDYTLQCKRVRTGISENIVIPFEQSTEYYTGSLSYYTKDDMCYLRVFLKVLVPASYWINLLTNSRLPLPLFEGNNGFTASTQVNKASIRLGITNDGNLQIHGGEAGDTDYEGWFAYPFYEA